MWRCQRGSVLRVASVVPPTLQAAAITRSAELFSTPCPCPFAPFYARARGRSVLMPQSDIRLPDAPAPDYAAFLQRQLPRQQFNVASYQLDGEQVWLKKAGPRHGMAGYRLLGALATLARLPVLRPVPNLGGTAAIATEAERLRDLAARLQLVGAVYLIHLRSPESDRWLLTWADHASQPEARSARQLVPADATINSGWPRRIAPLQNELVSP